MKNDGQYAARLCDDLVAFGYDDWFLPAIIESIAIRDQLGPTSIGGSGTINSDELNWTSTEFPADTHILSTFTAYVIGLGNTNGELSYKTDLRPCRCVRK